MKKHIVRIALGAALAVGLTLPVGIATHADRDWGSACHQRLENARAKIDRDAARHGNDSPQVRHDRDQMESARQWCRSHHADWDHNRFDMGIYIK